LATSNSYDFGKTVTRDDIIKYGLRKIGVLKRGQTLGSDDLADASTALNLIIKQLQDRSDGSPSVKMWLRKRLVLFLQDNQYEYRIGSSAVDHCADVDDLLETTLSAAATSGASTLTLNSVSGAATTNYIGLYQDNGIIHWTTINGAPAGNVVTLTAVTTNDAASGNPVYVYSTRVEPPLYLLTQFYRNENGDDWPMSTLSVEEYDLIPDKNQQGTPNSFYYEKSLTEGLFFLDTAAEDARDTIRMTAHYPAQDMDAAGDTFDFADIWLRPLGYMLGLDLSPEYDIPIDQGLMALTTEAVKTARDSDPETTNLVFESGR